MHKFSPLQSFGEIAWKKKTKEKEEKKEEKEKKRELEEYAVVGL